MRNRIPLETLFCNGSALSCQEVMIPSDTGLRGQGGAEGTSIYQLSPALCKRYGLGLRILRHLESRARCCEARSWAGDLSCVWDSKHKIESDGASDFTEAIAWCVGIYSSGVPKQYLSGGSATLKAANLETPPKPTQNTFLLQT